jgi:hypothetical protein
VLKLLPMEGLESGPGAVFLANGLNEVFFWNGFVLPDPAVPGLLLSKADDEPALLSSFGSSSIVSFFFSLWPKLETPPKVPALFAALLVFDSAPPKP